jgi:gliding motility-associated lipoprotein GldH
MKASALLPLLASLLWVSCYTPQHVVSDEMKSLSSKGWHWNEVQTIQTRLEDTAIEYKMVLKLRISGGYRYANLYLLFLVKGPDGKTETRQYNFNLQDKNGRWYGKGSGELMTFEIPVNAGLRAAKPGVYQIGIQQNMRDETLQHVTDVGLRIEKGKAVY